jgi:GT2 family glycosyltransferase
LAKTAVVILNWNGRKFLEQFLPGVIEHTGDDAEVIVADNGSTDSSLEFMENNFPQIRVIQNITNGGFAKGYNDALKQVSAEYFVLLNSDIEVTPNWVNPVVELMDSDPMIAACQPKLRSYYQRDHFEYAGAAGGFIDKWGYPYCKGRLFMHVEKDEGQYDEATEVFWATGACMFVRADLYHQFGGLDEDFFAHMEEIDFCWRLKNAGYKIMYTPESVVYHVGGGTLPKVSAYKTYLNMRNNIVMLYKNLPRKRIIPVITFRFFMDLVASVKFLFDGGFNDFIAVIRAQLSFIRRIKRNLFKRNNIKHKDRVSGMYYGNIVVEHFLKGKKTFTDLDPKKLSR